MSVTLTDLQGELREYYSRIEEVLSGMDVLLTRLEDRVAKLEGKKAAEEVGRGSSHGAAIEERLSRLEGQLGAIVAGLYGDAPDDASGIIIGR